ncbi:MAG TPA: nitroreductase family deazaflavin-dependent oxidoreductase [Dehalococcoidia bacterium]|nr:nitroreductase family deazaflavin-dependent oxidoreductase [Dehalococcoidia bacterium]
MALALKRGFGPSNSRLLTVRGRTSGRPYTTPVNLVLRDGKRYLVAPYGEPGWATNARAAGEVALHRGKLQESLQVEELGATEAVPVLRQYYQENPITRGFFDVDASSTDGAFRAEAPRHPVFRLK